MSDPATGEPALLLHETVDITGQGAWRYMEHTRDAAGDEKVSFELQGTWYVMGITGRWPQVVNLWDVPGGWDGWLEAVDRLNLARPANQALDEWWKTAYEMRSGGVDRLLAAAPGCPTTEELESNLVTGTLFVHERARCRPGAVLDYLAAVLDERSPLLGGYGQQLTGLYEVLLTDDQVVTVWATTPEEHVRLTRAELLARRVPHAPEADDRLARWRATASGFLVERREELMTPCPGTRLGPPLPTAANPA